MFYLTCAEHAAPARLDVEAPAVQPGRRAEVLQEQREPDGLEARAGADRCDAEPAAPRRAGEGIEQWPAVAAGGSVIK